MDRRSAIKTIGLGLGISVTYGTFLSTFASCKNDAAAKNAYQPLFLTDAKQFSLVEKMADIILPKTNTPGALEVGVPRFIDTSVQALYKPEEQVRFRKGLDACIVALEADQGGKVENLKGEQIEAFLQKHIGTKADKAAMEAKETMLGEKEPPSDPAAQNDYYLYGFLNAVKSMTIAGYFGSEMIGEKYLKYDPIPGPYQGCIPYDGGAAYALN